jgi:hypothetical protein
MAAQGRVGARETHMRIWLSFPRILGLVRPGISFNLSELTRLLRRGRSEADAPAERTGVGVQDWRREDVVVSRRGSQEPGHLDMTVDLSGQARARLAEVQSQLPPPPEYPLRDRIAVWLILAFAAYGFLSMVGCAINIAHAGTCRYYSDGPDSVVACDNGAFTVIDRHGRKWVYGDINAGFERYPGQEGRPVFERRE